MRGEHYGFCAVVRPPRDHGACLPFLDAAVSTFVVGFDSAPNVCTLLKFGCFCPACKTRQSRNFDVSQIPKGSDPLAGVAGVNVRDAFAASRSFTLMAADYSQIEVKLKTVGINSPKTYSRGTVQSKEASFYLTLHGVGRISLSRANISIQVYGRVLMVGMKYPNSRPH